MKQNRFGRFAATISGLALLGLMLSVPAARTLAQTSGTLPGQSALTATPDIQFIQRINNQVPLNLTFQDETGKPVVLKQFFHDRKPVILVTPFYKCMGGCTLELKGMAEAFNKLNYNVGDDFEVVTVSINPKETADLAAKQKAVYTQLYPRPGGKTGWHFLVGTHEAIHALTDSIGFKFVENLDTEQFGHATGIVVLTPQGKAFRYFYGSEYSPRELRMALNEASNNKLGTVVDQLLILCYHYDPTTGHYGLIIQRILIAAGMATVVILASSILLMLRWERRHPRSMHESNDGTASLDDEPLNHTRDDV